MGVEILKESQVNGKETDILLEEGNVDIKEKTTVADTIQTGNEIQLLYREPVEGLVQYFRR